MTLANVSTDMGPQVLAYNVKRGVDIFCIARNMEAVHSMGK
jgi:hypothetical protein